MPPPARMTNEQYVAGHGGRCPFCHHNDIEGDETNFDGGSVSQEVHCNNCHASWYDLYALTSYEVIDSGDAAEQEVPGKDEPDQ
jgi:hypothetical protein